MAKWIKTSGEIVDVQPKNGTDFSLNELQGFVGGYIEVVGLDDGKLMVVNEEGKINGLCINSEATLLSRYDIIVGDVLVCDSREIR